MKGKKKFFITFLIIFILIIIEIIFIKPDNKNPSVIEDGVYIKIEENSLTNESATITVVCENDNTYLIGKDYHIEKFENKTWVKLKEKEDMVSTMEGYWLNKNNSNTFQLNWSRYYGALDSGLYRIVKSISLDLEKKENKYIVGEFTIN